MCWVGLYSDVIMDAMASQITSIYSTVYSGAGQRKHQSSASLAFVWGIHWWQMNSPHKWPATRKMFPFDDVIMGPVIGMKFYNTDTNHRHIPLHGPNYIIIYMYISVAKEFSYLCVFAGYTVIPVDPWSNDDVIITLKRHHNVVLA